MAMMRKGNINRKSRTGTRFIAFLMAFALTVTALPLYSATETAEAAETEAEEAESTESAETETESAEAESTAAWGSWEELYAAMVEKEDEDGLYREAVSLKNAVESGESDGVDFWALLVAAMDSMAIGNDWTDYEKVYTIANWIGANVSYGGGNVAYEAIVYGQAMCRGYAGLFCIMCAYVGVDAMAIQYSGTQHEWNAVCVDGNWYWADLTSFTSVEDDLSSSTLSSFLYGNDSARVLWYQAFSEQAIFTGSSVCELISDYSYYYNNSSCSGNHTWEQNGTPVTGVNYDCEPGLAMYICTECGCEHCELIESETAHTYEAVTVEPTCTTKGYTAYVCSVCGEYYVEDYYTYKFDLVDAVGHTDDNIEVTMKEPTCTAAGYAYTHCSYCGRVMQTITLAATGHDWDEGTVTEAAGVVSTGTLTYECQTCGATKTETIAATGGSLEDAEITLEYDTCEYDGTAHMPEVTVCFGNETAENTSVSSPVTSTSDNITTTTYTGDMYTVTYYTGNKYKAAGEIPVIISGGTNGLLTGEVTVYFTIEKAATTVTASIDTDTIEAGSTAQITASAEVNTTGTSRTCYYSSSDGDVATVSTSGLVTGVGAGVAVITVYTAANASYYEQGYAYITVTVTEPEKTDISGADVVFGEGVSYYVYDGTAKEPGFDVAIGTDILEAGTDYTVTWKDNTDAGTATVLVAGCGNYTGSLTVTFEITPASIADAEVAVADDTLIYDGTAKEPEVTVTLPDGTVLTEGTDYTVLYSDNINAGTAAVTVTGTGNYTGTASASFGITAEDISGASVTLPDYDGYVYDGTAKEPEIEVSVNGTVLAEGTDYVLEYSDNTNAGTAVITVTGTGNYTGEAEKTFMISKADAEIYAEDLEVARTDTAVITASSTSGGVLSYVSSDESVSTVDADGNVTGVSLGSAVITVTAAATANYNAASAEITVTVYATPLTGAEISLIGADGIVYDGTVKEPEVTVALDGTELAAGTDYTAEYSGNINAGTATVTVSGTGRYTGSVTVTFEIAKATQEVTFAGATEYTTGDALNLTASSTGDGTVTVAYTDADGTEVTEEYMLSNAGTYTAAATAAGTDNYEAGSASVTVTVSEPQEPTDMSGASVRVSPAEYTYDGTAKEPEITVTLDGTTLTAGTDYTVSYSDNTDAGTATVTVTGIGSYTGSAEACFTINRAAQELSADNFSVTAGSTKTLSISGAAGTLSYESSGTSVATVSADGTVTGVSAGEAIITVIAAETDNYEEGCIDITVTVTRRTQELSVSPETVSLAVGETSALTVSGAETTLTFLSSDETVALVSRTGVITAVSAGTAMITVEAEQTDVCEGAAAEMTVTVGPAAQELTVSSPSVTLAAGKTSEITVSGVKTAVTYASSDETVATVSASGVITAVSAGTATITVTAAGTDSYTGATAQVEVTVTRNAQSISVGNPSPILAAGETSAVAVSGAETVLTYKSSDTSVATVSSMGTITAVSAGTATITVTAAQTGQYSAASATVDVTVYRNTQKISVASANVGIYAGETSAIGVNGAVTALSYKSSNTAVATVSSSGVITAVSAGTATITVTAEETGQYYGASATVAVTVKRNTQDMTVASAVSIAAGKTSAISVSGAKTTLSYKSSNTSVATVSSTGVITAVSAGTADITITAEQTGQYEKAAITVTVTVTRNTQSLSVSPTSVSLANGGTKTLSVSGAKTTLSYKSSNTSVATVNSSGKITAKGVGTATITVTAAQTGQYTKATATVKVTVVPAAPAISSVKNTTTGVKVTWGKVAGATKYYVYRKVSGGSYEKVKTVSSGSTVSWTDTSASSGKTYYYKVYAYASMGKSAASAAKSVKYLAPGEISSLTNVSDGITVKWSKVTGASGYYVYRKTASGSYKKIATVGKSVTSYTDTAVKSKNGTTYYYCVKAYSGSTTGSYTGKKTVRLTAALSSATNSASKALTVKIKAANSKATGYQIQYSTSSTFASGNKTVKITSASTLSKKITGLTKGKTYYVRVRAYKTVDGTTYYSAWSSKKSVKVSK